LDRHSLKLGTTVEQFLSFLPNQTNDVIAMLQKARNFANRLHEDESGPNTVEWVLLIIVALVILAGIYAFVQWAFTEVETQQQTFGDTTGSTTAEFK
jgi:Flp pilus assembly pilin Flp